jgi:hypothetical protein
MWWVCSFLHNQSQILENGTWIQAVRKAGDAGDGMVVQWIVSFRLLFPSLICLHLSTGLLVNFLLRAPHGLLYSIHVSFTQILPNSMQYIATGAPPFQPFAMLGGLLWAVGIPISID